MCVFFFYFFFLLLRDYPTSSWRSRERHLTRMEMRKLAWRGDREYLHFQLEPVQRMHRRRVQERAVRRRGELHQELVPAGGGLRDGLPTAAELQDDRVPRRVAVVDGHVVLHVVARAPHLQLSGAGGAVEGGLAPDRYQLALRLPDSDHGVLPRHQLVLADGVVAG